MLHPAVERVAAVPVSNLSPAPVDGETLRRTNVSQVREDQHLENFK